MRVRQLVPLRARSALREWQRKRQRSRALERGIEALRRQPDGSDDIWQDLAHGWGGWAANPELLAAAAAAARSGTGPVLECGSGLTTLVLATVSGAGSQVWSLEHDPRWYDLTSQALRHFGLEANLLHAPLRDYGDFEWYDVDAYALPRFSVVICDGPPNSTRGGRYGLVPVLGDRLAPDCIVLLDDADRLAEQEVLRRWSSEASLSYEIRRGDRAFAVLTPANAGVPRQPRRVAAPGRPRRHSLARIARSQGLRAPWVTKLALVFAGVVTFAATAGVVEVLTDRDWRLSGFEWPADFLTAAVLACLVPLALGAAQGLLDAKRSRGRSPEPHARDGP
jgi:hypothetical protein